MISMMAISNAVVRNFRSPEKLINTSRIITIQTFTSKSIVADNRQVSHFFFRLHFLPHFFLKLRRDLLQLIRCRTCSRVYERKRDLWVCTRRHRGIKSGKFKCDVCGRACENNNRLQAHKKSHDPKKRPSKACDQCNRM